MQHLKTFRACIRGIDQRGATQAIGRVTIERAAGTTLPALLELAASNAVTYVTTTKAAIPAADSIDLPALVVAAGTQGNPEIGAQLTTIEPIPAFN
jgi:hypothetical protein